MHAELRRAGGGRPGPRRGHRAPAVVLRAVPAGPPDDLLPAWSARAASRSSATASSAGRWSTSTTSSTGCVAAELAPTRRRAGLLDRRRPAVHHRRDRRHGRPGARGRGLRREAATASACRPSSDGSPSAADGLVQRTGPLLQRSCTCSARWTRPSPATSPSPARSSATSPQIELVRGHAAQHPLVPGAGARAVTGSLVTGGNGYFGRLLVEHLAGAGRRRPGARHRRRCRRPAGAGVEMVLGDIRDERRVREAVDGVDVVFHNVAQVPLARDHHLLRSVNVDGTALLLAASAEAGVAKVVHTSSSAVFGVPEREPGPADHRAHAAGGLRRSQAGRRVGLPAGGRRRARRLDRPPAHDPRPRSPRHLRHPLRLDRRRRRPVRARRRDQPLPVRPRRRPRRRLPAGRRPPRGRRSSTPAPIGSARCAKPSSTCARTPAPGARVRSLPAGPAAAAMHASAALAPRRRSRRTTG